MISTHLLALTQEVEYLLILIGVVVGSIILMIVLNKILDWIYVKIPVIYNGVMILFAVGIFVYGYFINIDTVYVPTKVGYYFLMHFIYFYLMFTGILETNYIRKTSWYWDDEYIGDTYKEIYHPAWWKKFIAVVICSAVCWAFGTFTYAWIPLIAEAGMAIFFFIAVIINKYVRR